ncbi:MAG: DciA family protein [Asticcacaulis sp.]
MTRQLPSLEESVRILRTTHTRRAPRTGPTVQKQVQPLLKSLQAKFEAADDGAGKLKGRWPEIVGESLSKLCEPVRVIKGRAGTGGSLEIRVGGAYAPLIQHQSATLLDRINLYLGAGHITRLRLIQAPLTQASRTPAPPRPQPLNAAEELRLQQTVADIGDARLKNALLRLGRAVVQREKNGLG